MTFGDLRSHAILNPYDVPHLPLKFVPLITNHPVHLKKSFVITLFPEENSFIQQRKCLLQNVKRISVS